MPLSKFGAIHLDVHHAGLLVEFTQPRVGQDRRHLGLAGQEAEAAWWWGGGGVRVFFVVSRGSRRVSSTFSALPEGLRHSCKGAWLHTQPRNPEKLQVHANAANANAHLQRSATSKACRARAGAHHSATCSSPTAGGWRRARSCATRLLSVRWRAARRGDDGGGCGGGGGSCSPCCCCRRDTDVDASRSLSSPIPPSPPHPNPPPPCWDEPAPNVCWEVREPARISERAAEICCGPPRPPAAAPSGGGAETLGGYSCRSMSTTWVG
jgi:hypothetical protein